MGYSIPIVLFIYKRLDTTKKVLDVIRKVQPERMYIVGEGPSKIEDETIVSNVRKMVVDFIDWPCEVFTNFAEKDIGVGKRMSSGISWVFEHEQMALFLEDDIIVDLSFFFFAEEMLMKYKDEENVMMISAYNALSNQCSFDTSYSFSYFGSIWGWASWKRSWEKYQFDLTGWDTKSNKVILNQIFLSKKYQVSFEKKCKKITSGFDTWDYQWDFARFINKGLTIIPQKNLSMNIGFRPDAVHTKNNIGGKETLGEIESLSFPLIEPSIIENNKEYSQKYCSMNYKPGNKVKNCLSNLKRRILKNENNV